MDDQWEFYASDGTQVLEQHAQFKTRMVLVPSGIAPGAHWLYEEVQPIDAPTMIWRCKTLNDLKAGFAYYAANGRWPTKH